MEEEEEEQAQQEEVEETDDARPLGLACRCAYASVTADTVASMNEHLSRSLTNPACEDIIVDVSYEHTFRSLGRFVSCVVSCHLCIVEP